MTRPTESRDDSAAIRSITIPLDHIVAEIAAAPLASECALRTNPIELDPGIRGTTFALWRDTEMRTCGAFPGFSIDEVCGLRDRLWFDSEMPASPRSLAAYLRGLSRAFLKSRGLEAIPVFRENRARGAPADEHAMLVGRRRWKWVSLALPPDLLLAGLWEPTGGPTSVRMLSPLVERLLEDGGFSESHLHVGAAIDPGTLWVGVLHAVRMRETSAATFASPGASLDEGRELFGWLVRAGIVRQLLATYLSSGRSRPLLARWLVEKALPEIEAQHHGGPLEVMRIRRVLEHFRSGARPDRDEDVRIQATYRDLTEKSPRWPSSRHSGAVAMQIHAADPIADILEPSRPETATPEMTFVAQGLKHLEPRAEHPPDALFASLFWQVVRVRCLFHRHVSQRPMTPGLQWFIRFYARISGGRRPFSTQDLLEVGSRLEGAGAGLRSLEIRTAPESDRTKLARLVDDVERFANLHLGQSRTFSRTRSTRTSDASGGSDPCPFEIGLVLHFKKERGGGDRQGAHRPFGSGSHADPERNPSRYRYARYYAERRREAVTLVRFLLDRPESLLTVRGLDLCTDELGVPTWVLAPLIRFVRLAGERASRTLCRATGLELPQLRQTAHLGEDFVHLLGGLRRISEGSLYLELTEGSRIGHGLALGVDPVDWARRTGRVMLTREERLFDLVFAASWFTRHPTACPSGWEMYLQAEIASLSELVFGEAEFVEGPPDLHSLTHLVDDLHSGQALKHAGFPSGQPVVRAGSLPGSPSGERLLEHYLTSARTFRRGHELVVVETAPETEALVAIQAGIRADLASRSIAIEVNPSSNLVIGNLGDLTAHPLWRLRDPTGRSNSVPLSICVGSDNPITFCTNIREEFQILHDTLILGGLSEQEATCWLEECRRAGLAARFTVPFRAGASSTRPEPAVMDLQTPP